MADCIGWNMSAGAFHEKGSVDNTGMLSLVAQGSVTNQGLL
ncbi:MAG TPA: hypothetical protein VF088_18795 [Pyrinomonadaceae bacterium]